MNEELKLSKNKIKTILSYKYSKLIKMVLTQLPMDLSNQAIIDVTRGIYKDALATKHVQVLELVTKRTLTIIIVGF